MVLGLAAWSKRVGLSGLEWSYMKKHYSLIPTLGVPIIGNLFFIAYLVRMLSTHPEITWKRSVQEPWAEYYNKQVKFVGVGRDYSIPSPAPKYR